MNNQFDELAKGLAQYATRTVLCLAAAVQLTIQTRAEDFQSGPLVDLSDPDAFAGCELAHRVAGVPTGAENEACIAGSPTNPRNVVAVWIGGLCLGIGAAVSMDGGKHWQQVEVEGLTLCTGGSPELGFDVASDPWLSFAPNGDLY